RRIVRWDVLIKRGYEAKPRQLAADGNQIEARSQAEYSVDSAVARISRSSRTQCLKWTAVGIAMSNRADADANDRLARWGGDRSCNNTARPDLQVHRLPRPVIHLRARQSGP